jgi:hypothetical protein
MASDADNIVMLSVVHRIVMDINIPLRLGQTRPPDFAGVHVAYRTHYPGIC